MCLPLIEYDQRFLDVVTERTVIPVNIMRCSSNPYPRADLFDKLMDACTGDQPLILKEDFFL